MFIGIAFTEALAFIGIATGFIFGFCAVTTRC